MSTFTETFSQILNEYIYCSGKRNYQVAKEISAESSDIRKWRQGKVLPSDLRLEALGKKLPIDGEGMDKLRKNLYLARIEGKIGSCMQNCLNSIQNMLNEICLMDTGSDVGMDENDYIPKNTIVGKNNCCQTLRVIVRDEARQSFGEDVKIWGGGKYTEEFLKLIFGELHGTDISCKHLFRVARFQKGKTARRGYEIGSSTEIVKWLCADWDYTPRVSYSEYSDIESGVGSILCIVMTSRYLLQFMEYESNMVAFLRTDEKEIEFMGKKFQKQFHQAMLFGTFYVDLQELQHGLFRLEKKMKNSVYYLENMMCVYQLYPEEVLRSHFLGGQEEFDKYFSEHKERVKNLENKNFTEIMTTWGIEQFVKMGEIPELSREMYQIFDIEERILALENWKKRKKQYKENYHIINIKNLPWKKFFSICGDISQCFLWYNENEASGKGVYLEFKEVNVSEWMYQYVVFLRNSEFAWSDLEEIQFVNQQIEKLKENFQVSLGGGKA